MDTNWKPAQNPRRWPAFISSFLTCKLFCPLLHEGTTSDDNPDSGPERLWIEGHMNPSRTDFKFNYASGRGEENI